MRSMTGFGKGIAESDARCVTVELRAVNHRFLDISTKLPRLLICCEDAVKKIISKNLSRGHVDVYITYEDKRFGKSKIKVDEVLAAKYLDIANSLAKLGFENDMSVTDVLRLPDVLTISGEEDDETEIIRLAAEATEKACEKLCLMRKTEGEMLKKDFKIKLAELEKLTNEIAMRAPEVADTYSVKLKARIEDALNSVEIDETRLLNEVAFFIDKANIDEELTRLKGHIAHFGAIIEENGSIGKKLDFLVQEINREINTTGSKSNDLFITERVLTAKNVTEMIREQVQNVE